MLLREDVNRYACDDSEKLPVSASIASVVFVEIHRGIRTQVVKPVQSEDCERITD